MSFDILTVVMYNNANRGSAETIDEAGSPDKKEQKNSNFFKAVKERKLGQLANEPLEKIRFGARS
ncbi:hypothetical protein ACE418_07335 [Megasphaera sp. WILCCON 0056]|uniref:hypothetical protein n=1 Tax=Megasphaera sp. WILCCON 0056 TaxID=3345340 RepID=UPI003A80ECA8